MKLATGRRKSKIGPWLVAVVGLGLIFSLLLNFFQYQKLQSVQDVNVVDRVIDGDTFVLKWGQRVKLRGVDTPEIEFCGGEEAKERLKELVLGKRVQLEDNFTDSYGRIIAHVYQGKTFVNEIILQEGWARHDRHTSSRTEILEAAYQLA